MKRATTLKLMLCGVAFGLTLGCSSTGLTGSASKEKSEKKKGDDGDGDGSDGDTDAGGDPADGSISTEARDNETKEDTAKGEGTAQSVFVSEDGTQRREVFEFGADFASPSVDYLFVIDNSPSMGNNVEQLQEGVVSLKNESFPAKAKLAVMNTMPAKPDDLAVSFNGAKQEPLIAANSEPGFMGLVTKTRIDAYKKANGGNGAVFKMPGCENGWFAPDDKDSDGNRCFDAASQISLKGGPCEAGIVAVAQLVEKLADKRLFRKGAVANVIFVSDTHDPGCKDADGKDALVKERPSFDAFKTALAKNSPGLAALKAHGIFPASACVPLSEGEFVDGPSYADFVKAGKGKSLDLCKATDFKGVIADIVASTQPEEPVFRLGAKVNEIISVSVDGVVTDDYEVVDGDLVKIAGLDSAKGVKVQVYYTTE